MYIDWFVLFHSIFMQNVVRNVYRSLTEADESYGWNRQYVVYTLYVMLYYYCKNKYTLFYLQCRVLHVTLAAVMKTIVMTHLSQCDPSHGGMMH